MCIILHNPDGRPLNKKNLRTAYENNPHGHGFMWVEGGQLNVVKGIAKDFDETWYLATQLTGFAYTLHLRWRTTGIISKSNCHPFEILNKEQDGLDFSMVHNGTIFEIPRDPKKSDTQIFSENLRKKILDKDPEYKLNYINKIEKKIGKHNKMVFMTSDNRTFFINKHLGKMIDGIWHSNTYSLEKGYRDKVIEPKKMPMFGESIDFVRGRWVHKRSEMPKWKTPAIKPMSELNKIVDSNKKSR